MGTVRHPGRINDSTMLIDVGMRGLAGVTAVYLIQGSERTCLIDAGTHAEAHHIIEALSEARCFPPDLIVLTHAHHDHAQGVPALQKEAAQLGQTIEVLASYRAVPLLESAGYNEMFDSGPYESIRPVTPLRENDAISLGDVSLRVYDLPGHSEEHIAILDEQSMFLYVGDAIGLKVSDDVYLPPFMPPSWDAVAFRRSIQKIRNLNCRTLCLTHFGCVNGQEVDDILDEALEETAAWWQLYENKAAWLDEPDMLFDMLIREGRLSIPELKTMPMAGPKGLQPPGEVFVRGLTAKLAQGYRMYRDRHSR
jgi:glyoxylase-like metal-dependent hydrolase (beta-lactamase superfamily II)